MRFNQLTGPARAFVIGTYVLALGLLLALAPHDAAAADALAAHTVAVWGTFVPLLLLATLVHSFPVHTPNKQSYYVSLPFFTAAILLLQPIEVAAVLVVPNLVEWRFRQRAWFAQLFNVAVYLIGGLAARAVYIAIEPRPFATAALHDLQPVLAAMCAIGVFLLLNRAFVTVAIALGNRVPAFGVDDLESLAGEAILLGMGLPLALAGAAPWIVVPAAAPLVLILRAFELPHMRAQLRHDETTGLFTRAYLVEAAARELNRARRFECQLNLLALEVAGLEAISAQHGRPASEVVLGYVAELLRQSTREYDVPARLGDSSFALLLPECNQAQALVIARRLQVSAAQRSIEIPSQLEPLHIKLNIGVAADGDDAQQILKAAEQALECAATSVEGLSVSTIEPSHEAETSKTAQPRRLQLERAVEAEPPAVALLPNQTTELRAHPRWSVALQIGLGVVAAGITVPFIGSFGSLDGWTTLWMMAFIVLAELLGVELFGRSSSYSISTVPIIAAGLLLGPAGAIVVAPVSQILRAIQLRTRWYKVVFNVNTQIVAGVAATSVFRALNPDLSIEHLAWMLGAATLAGATYYMHTLLIATAMGTELRVNPLRIWLEHFRWLWIQYVVLGTLGLLLALAYHLFGLLGGLIFVVPAVMMRYVAKQYLDKTMDHVRQLRALNERLAGEVTQRKQSEANLEHRALHDVLTDLPNRLLLHDRTQQSLFAAQRDGHSMALLLLDLDRFKEVNDTLGHQAGDELLKQAARRLRETVRQADTIARLGGDEFAAVLPTADVETASETAERIMQAMELPFDLEGRQVEIHASIGIAISDVQSDAPEGLLRRADVAMYAAKRAGGGGYEIYAASQDDNTPEHLALTADLRLAIANDELELHYQPKLDLRTGRMLSVEALVRWQHPVRGLLPPAVFVPLAEASVLIEKLSEWVLNAALRQCRQWRDAGLAVDVAVNLSMRDLHRRDLPDIIAQLLGAHGLVPDALIVEITESVLMADPQRALEVTSALKRMGVRLAIDDFGTGYSSLSYLKQFAAHELKIDQSFVRHLAANAEDAAIVRSTISLAHELGLSVVAEGVEDGRTWQLLTAYGCDVAQGFFISRPVPAAKIMEFVGNLPPGAQHLSVAA